MTDVEQPAEKKLKIDDNGSTNNGSADHSISQSLNAELLKEADQAIQQSNKIHIRPVVDETKLGIELFVGDQSHQFHGLIKSRYADFIVHEVDPDGNTANLTNLDPPEEQESTSPVCLSDFVDDKAMECLTEVNDGYLNQYKIDVTGMDKDARTSLHHAIRASFDRLESTTSSEVEQAKNEASSEVVEEDKTSGDVTTNQDEPDSTQQVAGNSAPEVKLKPVGEEKKYIVVTRRNKVTRPRNFWPRDRPDHTYFILYKENKDTMEAIHTIAASMNSRAANFHSAGVKDRRAITTQWLSSWRLEPKRLIAATKRFNKRPFLKVGNFCFKKEPLRLGHLKANKFDIVIRHLVHNSGGSGVIDDAMESIKTKGFINYFGLQRFGTRTTQTHEVGLAILQSKWDKAVDLILSYRYEDDQNQQAKDKNSTASKDTENDASNKGRFESNKRWNNGANDHNAFIDLWKSKLDSDFVFKKYPQFKYSNEGQLMKYLSKSADTKNDYLGALTSLPRTVRSMYVHSYQSLLWNRMTSYRLKTHGHKVIPGDLILSSEANISDNSLDLLLAADEVVEPKSTTDETEQNAETVETSGDGEKVATGRKAPIDEIDSKIIIATEENLHKYNIFEVVLPLVGSRVRLPQNDVGKEFERLLKEDGLTLECFRAREKLFISYGSYRKILVRPENVEWRIEQYSDPNQNLIETDLDKLNNKNTPGKTSDNSNDNAKATTISRSTRSPPKSDSSDEALIVSFQLPPSCYATMCLREIMKTHHDLNNRH